MLQRTIGNQAVLRLLAQEAANRAADRPADKGPGSGSSRSFARIAIFPHGQAEHQQQRLPLTALPFRGVIQPKLEIGAVNDPLEAEADRVAEQVMRTPDPVRRATPGEENVVRRSCVACEENVSGQTCAACEAEEKQARASDQAVAGKNPDGAAALDGTAAPSIVEEVLRSPGQPLATQDLDFFGPRFGFDLSRVRIHTGHTAAKSAQSVNALAYASGANIVFAAGQYRPGTEQGRRLLAHELAHVGQQNFGDGGRIRRLGDVRKVPAGLSCTIPDWNAPGDEFVLFPIWGPLSELRRKPKSGHT